ncbi:hypothetical protein L249_3439 [Ophiocordyceps polyrhachis-furcata BCC 54312]|uniref:Uncharacterized protein n=1 Tax=Ophiocordyceps polyrhachis-furcata BCC 54312 TaxID=1330021 RepID=A0A367LMF2_9HYPO|nr:hypothetical protein L249_3439 [Ophiocordyceps polyrhachis-furcata BCC 54312]
MPGEFTNGDRGALLIPDLLDSLSMIDGDGGGGGGPPRAADELPLLSGEADWARWIQEVEGLARLWGVWDYVDPAEGKQLVEPERPSAPRAPTFIPWTRREANESDADHEARLAEHKVRLDFLARTFAIKQEQHRVECIEYAIKRKHYQMLKDEMDQLDRKMYASVDDKLRLHLMGGMTSTPHLKLKQLERLVLGSASPRSIQESPRSQFGNLMHKLETRGPRDWSSWATEIARLGKSCSEELGKSRIHDRMAKDGFLESIQDHHPGFYRRWSDILDHVEQNGQRTASFQDLVNAFVGAQDKTSAASEEGSVCSDKKADNRKRYPTDDSNGNDSPTLSNRSMPPSTVYHRRCPGCRLSHRIKGDYWWQSCWYFDAYMGRKTAPSFFNIKAESVEYVRNRLEANPEEQRQAKAWDARR